MRLALVPVAPFTLLGFAAVTARSMRSAKSRAVGRHAPSVTVGGSSPMLAVCRVDVDLDMENEVAEERVYAQSVPTGVAVLRFTITPTGDIRDLDVIVPSGFPALDSAAIGLVRIARVDASVAGQYRATVVFTE